MIPNPLHRGSKRESLFLSVTPKLLMVLAVPIIAYTVPGALASLTRPPPTRSLAPYALEAPPLDWTTDGSTLAPQVLTGFYLGKLPKPDPRQRTAPCDKEAEAEINGVCWIALDAKPPKCPKGRAWSHEDGKCYAPVLRAAPVPSSGGALPVSVAGEGE